MTLNYTLKIKLFFFIKYYQLQNIMDTTILTLLTLYLFPRYCVPPAIIHMIMRHVPGGTNVRQISIMGSLNRTLQTSIQELLTLRFGDDIPHRIMSYMQFVSVPRNKMQYKYYTGKVLCNGYTYTPEEWDEYDYNDGYGCGVPCCHCGSSFETERIERFLPDPHITFLWDKRAIPENFKCRTLKKFLKFLYTKMVCNKHDSLVDNSPFAGDCLYAFEVKIVTADTRVYTYLPHAPTVSKKTIVSFVIMLDDSPHDKLLQLCKKWE